MVGSHSIDLIRTHSKDDGAPPSVELSHDDSIVSELLEYRDCGMNLPSVPYTSANASAMPWAHLNFPRLALDRSSVSSTIGLLLLGKSMFLQECVDLIARPQMVVNLAVFRLSNGCKLDWRNYQHDTFRQDRGTHSSRYSTLSNPWSCLEP